MAKKRQTKEQVYDATINPLMAQIIEICKEHKIPVLATFHLGDDLHCTTSLLEKSYEPSSEQLRAAQLIAGESRITMLTVRDGSGKIKESHALLG